MNLTITQPMSEPAVQAPAHEHEHWIITYSGHPVRLVKNVCGRVWSTCHQDDATTFPTHDAALRALEDWHLRGNPSFSEHVLSAPNDQDPLLWILFG